MYTNLKHPLKDRKNREHMEVSLETAKLGEAVWRHDPVECTVVLIEGVRTFVTMEQYKAGLRTKKIDGKVFTIAPNKIKRQRPRKRRLY